MMPLGSIRTPSCAGFGTRTVQAARAGVVRPVGATSIASRFPHTVAAAVKDDDRGSGGTGLLERPDLDLGAGGNEPSTESGYGDGDTNRARGLGGGNHRVLLLDSEKHTEKLVVNALTTVVNCDPDHALNCFHTSKQLGMAIVTTCMKEHAEFFVQQLWRRGCRASFEPDTSTI